MNKKPPTTHDRTFGRTASVPEHSKVFREVPEAPAAIMKQPTMDGVLRDLDALHEAHRNVYVRLSSLTDLVEQAASQLLGEPSTLSSGTTGASPATGDSVLHRLQDNVDLAVTAAIEQGGHLERIEARLLAILETLGFTAYKKAA